MRELRGWSGWKLAVFPWLEILLFLSFPFLWVHPLGVYPPGRVVLFPLFLLPILRLPYPPSGFCFFFSSHSSKSRVQDLLGPLNALSLQGLWIVVPLFYSSVDGGVVVRRSGSAGV